MTTSHLPRRAVVGAVLATSLIGGGLAVAFAEDAPAAGACPSWSDPAGDATTAQAPVPPLSDDQMDIVGVSLTNDGANVVAAIKVTKLGDTASDFGDEYHVNFTLAGKAMQVYTDRGASQGDPLTSPVGFDSGFYNITDSTSGAAKSVYDLKTNTVTITGTVAELSKALGSDASGKTATALVAESQDYLSNPVQSTGFLYDDAPTKLTFTVGADCAGGAAPVAAAPAPSAVPSPDVSPAPAPAPPVAGGGDPSKLPNADCSLAKDPKGDASIKLNASAPGMPNDPDLDLTSMTLGSDDKNLYAYLKLDKLAAGPAVHDGHRFYVNFTFNKHNFTAAGSAYKDAPAASLKDGLAQSGQVAHVTQLAVDGVSSATDPNRFVGAGTGFVSSGLKFVFDVKTSTVTAVLPIADIEKYGKAPVAGAVFSGVYGGSYGDAFAVANPADAIPDGATTPATSKLTWSVGDNACFGAAAPAASPLSNVGVVKAQYGDTAAVAAKLVDAAGAPVAGKTVSFTVGASTASGVTGADGIAKSALVIKDKAGKRSLVLASDALTTSVPFTVLVEKTALKATGAKGAVTATLTDDDKKPVVGQVVTFASGSKTVTAKTDAKGVAKASGLPAGNIKVSYAGAAGMYTAASTTTKA
ncbi:MAG: hypothetical protein JWP11_3842 [Frankiales bacterium]|nr:hypothetical protein [Frankiales bacterium]